MTRTGYFCTAVLIGLAIYDVIRIQHGGLEASVSWWVHWICQKSPTVIFAMGYLCGHFLAAMRVTGH